MPFKHKFHVSPPDERRVDGILFDSKREAAYYQQLKLEQRAGEVVFFLRQVAFDLPGNLERYWLDFLVFRKSGEVDCVDVKGVRTSAYRRKKRLVEELYPIKILEL